MEVFSFMSVLSAVMLSACWLTFALLSRWKRKRETPGSTSIMIVIGSGGHTKEMLSLTEKLGAEYCSRQYVVAASDSISIKKIYKGEEEREAREETTDSKSQYSIYTVPRSREVKQSWVTTLFTTFYATFYSLRLVFQLQPQVILCNGPGTCVPLCYAGLILKLTGVSDTKIVYVESICRVETLSLSARLVYPIANSLVVQWPDLVQKYPKCKYLGRVV